MKARINNEKQGFRAVIESEKDYYDILLGNRDVKDEHRDNVTHYEIPATIFERLLELDRQYMRVMIKVQQQQQGEDAPPNRAYEEFLRRFPGEEQEAESCQDQ